MNTHLPEHRSISAGRAPRFQASSRRLAVWLSALALAGMSLLTSGCGTAASDEPVGAAGEAVSKADPTLVSSNDTSDGTPVGEKGTVTWNCGPGCICYPDGSIDCRKNKDADRVAGDGEVEAIGPSCAKDADDTLDSPEEAEKGLPWLCGPNCVCYPDGSFDCTQTGIAKGVTWNCPCGCICYSDGSIDCRKQPAQE